MSGEARLEGGRWRVTFERSADRYAHRIEWLNAGNAIPLLQSIEGTPDEDWPASPALKELHLEDRPGGKQLALLVGMAGRSHWSLSVELDPHDDRLVFDVACRVRDEPARLTSGYRLAGIPGQLLTQPPRIALPHGLEIQTQPIDNIAAALAQVSPDIIAIQPQSGLGKLPRTIRWRYALGPSSNP